MRGWQGTLAKKQGWGFGGMGAEITHLLWYGLLAL